MEEFMSLRILARAATNATKLNVSQVRSFSTDKINKTALTTFEKLGITLAGAGIGACVWAASSPPPKSAAIIPL